MSDLTPELAEKVIKANLRNIIKKIGDGGTLSQPERELMEQAKLDGQLSEELLQARRVALVRKYARGDRLNAEEIAEISEVIPTTAPTVKKITDDNYRFTFREYVEKFVELGMEPCVDGPRKLKNWVWHGRWLAKDQPRDPPDLPPFDQPEQLAAWWRRCMTYRPPEWMTRLEKDGALEPQQAEPSAGTSQPAQQSSDGKAQSTEITGYGEIEIEGEIANDFTVRVLAGAAMDSRRRYEEARIAENWRQARLIREELIDDVKALQRAQVDALKVLAAKGDYLEAKKTMQSLNGLLAMQDTSFYNALEEVIRIASPQMDPDRRRTLALEYRDKVFEHFHRTEFAQAWTPIDHAA